MGRRRNGVTLFAVGVVALVALAASVLVAAGGPGWVARADRTASHDPRASATAALPTVSISPPPATAPPSPTAASATPSQQPTPTATSASTSPPPSASPGGGRYVQSGSNIVFVAPDGTVVPVPPIGGLKTVVADGHATYVALARNAYGLRAGAYAGEFKPNVNAEQADGSSAQTGGAVLVGRVVARLLADRFAATAAARDRWLLALPVDIRNTPLASSVEVSFDHDGLNGSWRVLVGFSGTLPVVNVNPDNAGYHLLVEQVGSASWQCIDPARLTLPADGIDASHPMSSLVVYGTKADAVRRDVEVDTKVAIGRRIVSASGNVSASFVVADRFLAVTPDRILSLGDVPVFAAVS